MPKILNKISLKITIYLFVASSIFSVGALRHNNQTMVGLRNAVYAADKDDKDVNLALNNLRSYVYGHMNTNLSSGNNDIKPPIQLKYTYQRLVNAQQNEIQAANSRVYTDAQNYCKSIGNVSFDTPCVQNYVVNHGVKGANTNIPAGLYQFDFISPRWSPDLAGWSLVTSALLFIALIVKLLLSRFASIRER